jgi:Cu/Ag efflux protein CusF
MTASTFRRSLFAAAATLGLAASAFAQAKPPLSAEHAALATVTAKVQAIDQTTREVTLKGPLGNVVTFTVDKRVARLNEVKVGDDVTVDYYVSVAAEVRPPTDAEKATPVTVMKETAKAPAGTEPAAGVLHITKAVVTVEGLDRPTKCVTVMGPKGNMATIEVADVASLSKLRIGDTVVITYTEALAVSLQKRPAK